VNLKQRESYTPKPSAETLATGESVAVEYILGPFGSGDHIEYWFEEDKKFAFQVGFEYGVRKIGNIGDKESCFSYDIEFVDGTVICRNISHFSSTTAPAISVEPKSGVLLHGNHDSCPIKERALTLYVHPQRFPSKLLKISHEAKQTQFFGFGERFNGVNQTGNKLDIRVYEEYKQQYESTRTYMPVPFFFTNDGWGMYLNSAERSSFDLNSNGDGSWNFVVPLSSTADVVEQQFYWGTPREILAWYTSSTEKPALPPEWVFGPWMSSNEWNSQERVLEELNTSFDLDIPATVLVIEAWSDEKNFYIWNDARYKVKEGSDSFQYEDFAFPSEGKWPNPKEMVRKLHDAGVKLILWQIPVLKDLDEHNEQHIQDKAYMLSRNYQIRTAQNEAYRVKPWWFPNGHVIDMTNPKAREWWLSKRRYLVDELGIDGFKTDGGEHIWGDDAVGESGVRGHALANVYPKEYIKGYYDFARTHNSGITFSRAGFTGVQSSPVHWTGDQNSTWSEHRSVLNAVFSAGLSGIPFVGWDIGGFSGEIPSAELFIRSAQMACFGSIMQFHSEFNNHQEPHVDRTPWNIAKRTGESVVVDIYRFYAKLRMKLLPYLTLSAGNSCESGAPLMRPMLFQYPENAEYWMIFDQYLLGEDILVAPILWEGQSRRSVQIPEGIWFDGWTEEAVEGPVELTVEAPLHKIPVFHRRGASFNVLSLFPLAQDEY